MGYKNPGWPGCCRPPFPTEYMSIPAAEWRAVNKVHNVPIPAEIKAVLDSISPRPSALSPAHPRRTAGDRKHAASGSSPTSRNNTLSKASGAHRVPRGSSPSASPNMSRNSSSTAVSSIFNTSPVDYSPRQRVPDTADKLIDGVHSSRSSPTRKIAELDQTVTPKRASSVKRPSVTPATTSVSVSKVVVGSPTSPLHNQASVRRKDSISKPETKREPLPSSFTTTASKTSPPQSSRSSPTSPRPSNVSSGADARNQRDDDDMSSSSGSSDGMLSDSTVTSDGGFTDYLSDESEAELQRQAEAKAAVVALNMAEELEFKAARLQLAHVDLRPPKTWNPANITNTPPSNRPRGASRAT
jgi:hypothetical protein